MGGNVAWQVCYVSVRLEVEAGILGILARVVVQKLGLNTLAVAQ